MIVFGSEEGVLLLMKNWFVVIYERLVLLMLLLTYVYHERYIRSLLLENGATNGQIGSASSEATVKNKGICGNMWTIPRLICGLMAEKNH